MPNETAYQATAKERSRRKRSTERGEAARDLIKSALEWKEDSQAAFVLASILVEGRNPKLLAAVWIEVVHLSQGTDYGARAKRIVMEATKALARDLV